MSITDAKPKDLPQLELQVIAWQIGLGYSLRNKMFNLGFEGSSELDATVSVIDQLHWALGDDVFGIEPVRMAAQREPGPTPKLEKSAEGRQQWMKELYDDDDYTVANAVYDDLGTLITQVIPDAVELESIYWTITDYPSTVGGRLATLNAGSLELLFISRKTFPLTLVNGSTTAVHFSRLNLAGGTLFGPDGLEQHEQRLREIYGRTALQMSQANYSLAR